MARTTSFFATRIYQAKLPVSANAALTKVCLATARDDLAGRRWAKAHSYRGYTSYASLDDLRAARRNSPNWRRGSTRMSAVSRVNCSSPGPGFRWTACG